MTVQSIKDLINEKMLSSKCDKEYYETNRIVLDSVIKLTTDDQKKLFDWFNEMTLTASYGYIHKLKGNFYDMEYAGLEKNLSLANDCYILAYQNGDVLGLANMATICQNKKEYKQSFELYEKCIQNYSCPTSQYQQATLYFRGLGVDKDVDACIKLLHININNPLSIKKTIGYTMHYLGYVYNTQHKYTDALTWYQNALQYEHYESYNNIARIYSLNKLVNNESNFIVALSYYEKYLSYLVDNNMSTTICLYSIYELYKKNKQYEKAMEWLLKGEALGCNMAIHSIGFAYDFGYGVPQSTEKAIMYYNRSGSVESYWNIGLIYHERYAEIGFTKPNYTMALKMFQRAYVMYKEENQIDNMELCALKIKKILTENYLQYVEQIINIPVDDKKIIEDFEIVEVVE